ncbi:MAG: Crp/Fnr family transcriptional regulator [Sterolibacterium sp.]|jgi:CRP-like cAMP-binding protein|nr:Crp/Fnr family transcriptional regulator [Sterolibacterium sp.]
MPTLKHETHDIPQILAHLPLFLELVPEQLAHIASHTREKRLQKGEMLFQKGDAPRGFYVIVFGQIKLAFPSSQGNEKVINILGTRQSFGEAAMFMDRPYPVYAEALADTLLLHIARHAVNDLLAADPSFARRMLAGLSMRLHALVQDVESYSLRSTTQRVIGFLLQHGETEEKTGNEQRNEITIALPTSKQVIASRLSLTPETLSRVFHELANSGLITVHGKDITIHDMTRLRQFDL